MVYFFFCWSVGRSVGPLFLFVLCCVVFFYQILLFSATNETGGRRARGICGSVEDDESMESAEAYLINCHRRKMYSRVPARD